jgi:hypothetical protein
MYGPPDPPNKQSLAEIAALLRQTMLACDIDKPTESQSRIHDEAASRLCRRFESALQQVIYEDARLLQIRIQVMHAVVHGPRYHRLHGFGCWSQYLLIRRQHLTIHFLIGIADRQRCVSRRSRASAQE